MAFEKLNYPLQWSKDEARFEEDIGKIERSDIDYAVREGRIKYDSMREDPPGALKESWDDLGLMIDLLEDWKKGEFQDIDWKTVSRIAGAVGYFSSDLDVIPDTLPGGFQDDALVLKRVQKKVAEDLQTYRQWKGSR
ncbi:MAG: DUF1232 domain-containing protein [Desulfuromonadales bacterium]